MKTNYRDQNFQPSLLAITAHRAELFAVLKPLAPDAWSRTATVTGAGKPCERTVYPYAQWLANHERSHFQQFALIAQTRRASSGPLIGGSLRPLRKPSKSGSKEDSHGPNNQNGHLATVWGFD